MCVILPVYGLHHDPKHFPNPEKFDPERFSEDNKNNIHKGAYLPFGNGPRACPGTNHLFIINLTINETYFTYMPIPSPSIRRQYSATVTRL